MFDLPLNVRVNYEKKHRSPGKLKLFISCEYNTYLMLSGSRWLLIPSLIYFLESTKNYKFNQ